MWNLLKTIRAGGAYCRIRVLYALRSVYADGFDFADLLGGNFWKNDSRDSFFPFSQMENLAGFSIDDHSLFLFKATFLMQWGE